MDIVEHVARAIVQAKGLDPMEPTFASGGTGTAVTVHTRRFNHEISAARAAIRSTLEHLRDNVSDGMRTFAEAAYMDVRYEDQLDGLLEYYRAMMTEALKELDAGRDEQ